MPPKLTGELLSKLRQLMKTWPELQESIHAYIIPSEDSHQSEYICARDNRRAFITGFNGSAGVAVVTQNQAALWTDGRYWLQAMDQMDDNWTLMKQGLPKTSSIEDWLIDQLPLDGGCVGVDPCLISAERWKSIKRRLTTFGHRLLPVPQNLIDQIWDDQPHHVCDHIISLPIEYTGETWQEKLSRLRAKMKKEKAEMILLTALDDIAWIMNLRGSDVKFNPVFMAYLLINHDSTWLFVDNQKLTPQVRRFLTDPDNSVIIRSYHDAKDDIAAMFDGNNYKIWLSKNTNQALYSIIPKNNRLEFHSPVCEMKAVKNTTEVKCMKRAHIKDAVALCQYFCWLEKQIAKGHLTECTGADKLEEFRSRQEDFVGLSFSTISSFGPNGAVIHYSPSPDTARTLTCDELYLCDSGGQYKDGTTDVTRTMHFGTPTDYQKECFTRVLKGHISLATVVFPNGVNGQLLDSLARTSLWNIGLDYSHGTGHGVGVYLNVHEGPCRIGPKYAASEIPLAENMILSNEPGYYEDGKFGIRIESLFIVKKAETKYNFKDRGFLTFESITLVPIQKKMLNPALLTQEEIDWLNTYHARCFEVIGSELKKQGLHEVYDWLKRETEPLG